MVTRHPTRFGIDQKQNKISFFDGLLGLRSHRAVDAVVLPRKPSGINHHIIKLAKHASTVLAIPGQTGNTGNQRVAGFG